MESRRALRSSARAESLRRTPSRIKEAERARIVALVDVEESRAKAVAERYEIETTRTDYRRRKSARTSMP